jgi:hypothetical protein
MKKIVIKSMRLALVVAAIVAMTNDSMASDPLGELIFDGDTEGYGLLNGYYVYSDPKTPVQEVEPKKRQALAIDIEGHGVNDGPFYFYDPTASYSDVGIHLGYDWSLDNFHAFKGVWHNLGDPVPTTVVVKKTRKKRK